MRKEIFVFEGDLTEDEKETNKKINGVLVDRILDPFVKLVTNKKIRLTIEEIY